MIAVKKQMGQEIDLMDHYPRSNRPIEERSQQVSDDDRAIAREFGEQYFDGDRLYGYGGYHYHPRFWQATVKRFRDHYQLTEDARILDVGCGKGFMLHDFKELMPELQIVGIDLSGYAIENAIETVRPYLRVGNAVELPFEDDFFDLVISINTIHNLKDKDCRQSLREIQRVSRTHAFLTVDAWRNEEEEKRMKKWNLTALTYMHVKDWEKIFAEAGYLGDYYWFIP
jgi:ubiquinone/menaquinone biosynthesis C-methylase UbiE